MADLLISFNMSEAKPVSTPMDTNRKLVKEEEPCELDEEVPYRGLVGV